jgi:hypothetical protein
VAVPDAPNTGISRFRGSVAVCAAILLLSSCGATLDRTPLPGTGGSTPPTSRTAQSIAPVTPDGFATGPGVSDDVITLGLIVDRARDRGFSAGVQLWQETVNTTGGLCGRSVQIAQNGVGSVPIDPVQAYAAIGRTSLGLVTLPAAGDDAGLNARIAADQLPTLTPSGRSTQLGPTRPIVVGATVDVLAINALDYLRQTDRLADGARIGVLTDGSAEADNGLSGARWWAEQRDVELVVRTLGDGESGDGTTGAGSTSATDDDLGDWGGAVAVLSLTDAATTSRLAGRTAPEVTILTTVDGYDPEAWGDAAPAAAGRVLVSSGAPAFGSDYPAAVAVATRFDATGRTNPGPRLFDGYATGATWGRLLTEACDNSMLTRPSVQQATTTVGAASVDSLFGPTDPGLPVVSALPATRVSALSVADPGAPTGLRPLTWPQAAADIEDYVP